MRISLTLLLAFAVLLAGQAQTQKGILKPAELIKLEKQQGKTFERIAVFQRVAVQKDIPAALTKSSRQDYSILRLERENLQAWTNKRPATITFSLPLPGQAPLEIELAQVEITASDFAVFESSSPTPVEADPGMHYRGTVKDDPQSFASVSIFGDEVMGVVSSPGLGNWVLGKLPDDSDHIFYRDEAIVKNMDFYCETPDSGIGYSEEELRFFPSTYRADPCVRVYFEVDHDIFQDKGGTAGAVNYVTSLFNEVATLYANEGIKVVISEILVWDSPSPYSGTSSSTLLNQFTSTRPDFNGNVAQLLSYQASGGIAYVDGLCSSIKSVRHSFSSIDRTYNAFPTYSFTVMVVTHELGHLLGSQHTHACVWNGNNTAIDGCAGYTEGGCPLPGSPSKGGTIMSYCHIKSVGIDFTLGFGEQPGNVIRNRVANASCLTACNDSGGGDNGGGSTCTDNDVTFKLVIDNYGNETTWNLKDASGRVVHSGGPYAKRANGTQYTESFCLPDGCYAFEILDSYGDGICCAYGAGSYSLTDKNGNILASGGAFSRQELKNFCLPYDGSGGGDNGGNNSNCVTIDFNNNPILSYGTNQDAGTYQLQENNTILKIQNNAWKAIALDYTVTASTVLELEFGSTRLGEIHGIGFDDDDKLSSGRTFKLYGTQNWGITNFSTYPGDNTWRKFVIPVGRYYTGNFNRLFFAADHDGGTRDGNSYYRNIKIYEGTSCNTLAATQPQTTLLESAGPGLELYPNPARQYLTLEFFEKEEVEIDIRIFNLMGQEVKRWQLRSTEGLNRQELDVRDLTPGTFFVQVQSEGLNRVEKLTITR